MHADFSPEDLAVQRDVHRFVAENDPADLHGKQGEDGALLKEEFQVWHKLLAKKGRVSSAWPVKYDRSDNDTRQQQGVSFRLMDVKSPRITVRPVITLGGEHRVREVSLEGVCVPVGNRVYEKNKGWTRAKFLLAPERSGGAGWQADTGRGYLALRRCSDRCGISQKREDLRRRGPCVLYNPSNTLQAFLT